MTPHRPAGMGPAALGAAPQPRAPAAVAAHLRLAFALMVALIVSLQFGPFIGLLGYRLTGSTAFTLAGGARDALVLMLVGVALLTLLMSPTPWRLLPSARWALLLVLVYTAFALASPEHPLIVALNLRRMALVPLLFVALTVLPWTLAQLQALMALVLASSVVVALFGLFERFAPPTLWTSVLDVVAYTGANPLDPWGSMAFESSGRYHSWDLEPATGLVLRRLVSTYLEPTTLAPTLALAMLLALAAGARRRQRAALLDSPGWATRVGALPLLFMLAGVLTVSKLVVLFLLVLMLWWLFGRPRPWQVLWLTFAGIGAALVLEHLGYSDGPFAHADGLASAARYMAEGHLLGEGLGAAGNYTYADTDVGAESGLGNGLVQVGLAALLPLVWVRAIALDAQRVATLRRDPGGPWLATWLLFWLLTYLLSASSLGVGGNALGFATLALYLHPAWGATAVGGRRPGGGRA